MGAELETTWVPIKGLTISANGGYDQTRYEKPSTAVLTQEALCRAQIAANAASQPDCGQGIVTAQGYIAAPARTPKWTGTLSFSYVIPVSNAWQLVPSGSGRFVSSANTNSAFLPITLQKSYTLFAGGISLENKYSHLSFSLGCDNCTDTRYLLSIISGHSFYSTPGYWFGRVPLRFLSGL